MEFIQHGRAANTTSSTMSKELRDKNTVMTSESQLRDRQQKRRTKLATCRLETKNPDIASINSATTVFNQVPEVHVIPARMKLRSCKASYLEYPVLQLH